MKKPSIILAVSVLSLTAAIGHNVHYALATPPTPPGGAPSNMARPSYSGATTIATDSTLQNVTYTSSTAAQNALLVSGGTSTISQANIEKTGNTSDENSDFYGTNAAVLVYNGATLNLSNSEITTNGSHANAVFAYDTGIVNISNSKITTNNNNSGGIMVTGGGTLNATNLNVVTAGNSAAAIRSDRGGGTMQVEGGTYKTTGQGSPAIYSTADITVKSAELIATASEGVVIEGKNSVTLDDVTLTDTNNTLNGNSETYKNIFIYQSMSGDASEGTGTFIAKNSNIITNKGDTFYVTNTTAKIELNNVQLTNTDSTGVLLRAEAAKWGNSGKNGGQVELTTSSQDFYGDIILDEISSLQFQLGKHSYYRGAINSNNTGTAKLAISKGSTFVLGGDTYLASLENGDETNANIYANGHKLYVDGQEVAANNDTPPDRNPALPEDNVESLVMESDNAISPVLIAMFCAAALVTVFIVVLVVRKKKSVSSNVVVDATDQVITSRPTTAESSSHTTDDESSRPKPDQSKQAFPKDIDVNDISPTDKE